MPDELTGQTIIHVLTTVHHGGAERVVLDLARAQRAMGADARVLCLQQLGALEPAFAAAGVPVALLPGRARPGAIRVAWRLAAALRAAHPTIVHTHNAAPQIAAGLGRRLGGWPRRGAILVHTEHGRLGTVRRSVLRWRRWTAVAFDRIFAVSADARAQLLQHHIRATHGVGVVTNGVDVSRFSPHDGSRPSTYTILHVGRLDQIKGQDVLLRAMPAVRAAIPSAHLVVVGDGPTRSQLIEQARQLGIDDIVRFAGATDDVRPFLDAADVFVLPSRSEGISVALLEAMAAGLPVVATDVGGNREVIDSPAVGRLVPTENPAAIAAALVSLLQATGSARVVGMAGRDRVADRFNSARTVADYAAHYLDAQSAASARATRSPA